MSEMAGGPAALLPELCLLIGAVTTLLIGAFSPRRRQWPATSVAAAALLACLAAAALGTSAGIVYDGTFAIDEATTGARLIVPVLALLVLGVSRDRVRARPRETEFAVLVLLASLGALILAGAADLLVLAVGYLLASIPLYALAAWNRDSRGAEAALKLYLLGVLLGIGLLFGIAVLAGVGGGRTGYEHLAAGLAAAPRPPVVVGAVAVLGGLLFKAGAAPAQFWVPDAAEGATAPAAAFLTTVPKIGGLLAAFRFVSVTDAAAQTGVLVAALAAVTMSWGNLAAFWQSSPARLLGWSTVSQAGYLLMAVAVADSSAEGAASPMTALLVYLVAYGVTTIAAFAVVAALPQRRTLEDYRGLARARPGLAAVLVVCLLGLVGTPPTAVFAGKLTVFSATWDAGLPWLVVVAAVNTMASLFYYLRWLVPAFAANGEPGPVRLWPARIALVAGVAAIGVGVSAGPLMAAFA